MKKNLLLLHGALGSGKSWQKIARILSDDFTVFFPDLPGHGSNGMQLQRYSLEEIVEFPESYIETNISGDYFIAGYSMGGYLALKLATKQPENLQGILTIATKFLWNPAIAEEESEKLTHENLANIIAFLQEEHHTNFPGLLENTKQILKSIGINPLTQKDLLKISAPVTVTLGDRDKMVTYDESKEFAGYIPSGKFDIIINQPHLLQKMDETVVAALVKKTFT